MADPVGAIRVALSVDSAAFEKGLNRARGRLSNFGQQIRTGIATMAKWAAGVAAAGVAIGTVFVRNAMKAIDALAKTADRLGMTTEGLARMRYAAEQTGVAANALDMAMQRMTRRISEAANDTGAAKDALRELGLDAKALAQMRPEEAFHVIADAMQGVTSQSERVRLAFKLFDSEGVALVNTLDLGAEGLRAMGEEADALGLSLSRVDAAKVEQANDAMTRVRRMIDGVANRITVHLAPYIAGIADLIAHWGLETQGFRNIIDNTMATAIRMTGRFSDAIAVVTRGINIGKVAQAQFGYAVVEAFRLAVRGVTALSDGVTGLTNLAIRGINALRQELGREALPELKGLGESGFVQSVEEAASAARSYLRQVGEEAGNVFAPLPSSKIEEWIEQVRSTADATAEEFATRLADRASLMDQFGGGGDGELSDKEKKALERERELLEQRLQAVREYLMTETELETLRYEERLELLREALEQELVTKEEYRELEADLAQAHADTLTKIEEDAAKKRAAIEEKVQRDITSMRETAMNNAIGLLQTFGQQSRVAALAAIALNKGLQIAQTLQNTATAEMRALAELGPIAGPPMAAKIRAWGMANVGLIAAQGLAQAAAGGSQPAGGVGRSSGGSAGGAIADTQAPAAGGGAPTQRTVHLNIVGDVFDQKTIRNLAEQINEFAEDGFRLTVRA